MTNPFSCLAMLEDETSQLYEMLKAKAEKRQVQLLLNLILQQTRTHRELLTDLSRDHGDNKSPSPSDCEMELGKLFTKALDSTRSLRQEIVQGLPVTEAVRKLVMVEDAANEEYVSEMQSQARAVLIERDPAVKTILKSIADDEKRHVEILNLILELAPKTP